jgi:hypothetical protein
MSKKLSDLKIVTDGLTYAKIMDGSETLFKKKNEYRIQNGFKLKRDGIDEK